MFNELQQEIIAAIAIGVAVLVFYFIFKRKSASQTGTPEAENNTKPGTAAQERAKAVPEKKEEVSAPPRPETPLQGRDETRGGVPPISEDQRTDSLNRRKCDRIIPKRSVPEHGKITKQNFAEFAGERILVAEDNLINQKVILGLLAESGIELVMANDGQEVLDILERDTNFVMILMDAHMPRIDGFQATRIIRANPQYDHILVVALSGDTAADDIQKMKDAGMSEQLAKPLRMEALYDIIYAYTDPEKAKEAAVTTNVLDIDKGVETCGGDEDFYREILSEFMADYAASPVKLGELLRSKNIRAADAYLLDIIGVTENIGAHPIGEIASALKLALSDTDEQSYLSLLDRYKHHFERLLDEIRAYR
ncbi:MAG: response regulator [Sulfuricurvum sp.]|nr:response regulator [Sulfuricurvum sp.]